MNYPVTVASLIPNVPISGVDPPAITCEPDYNDRDDRGLSPGANDRDTNCRVVGFGSDVGGAGVVDCEGDGDNDDMGRPAGRNDLDLKCRDATAPSGGGVHTCALDEPITVYLVGGGGDAVLIPLDHTNVLSVGPQSLTFTVDPNTGLASLLVEVLNPAALRDGLTVDAVWPDEGVRRSIELIPPAASHGVSGSEAPPTILPTPEATPTSFPEQPPGFAGEQGEVAPNLTATAVTALIQENCP